MEAANIYRQKVMLPTTYDSYLHEVEAHSFEEANLKIRAYVVGLGAITLGTLMLQFDASGRKSNIVNSNTNTNKLKNSNMETNENAGVEQFMETNEKAGLEQFLEQMPEIEKGTLEKAQTIIGKRLPHLSELGLSFEKRTLAFVKRHFYKDEAGVERIQRLVMPENELPSEGEAAREIAVKRAAAFLQTVSENESALIKKIVQAMDELEGLRSKRMESVELVEGFELPAAPESVTLKAQLEKRTSEAERMRALLVAMGIDPDTGERLD